MENTKNIITPFLLLLLFCPACLCPCPAPHTCSLHSCGFLLAACVPPSSALAPAAASPPACRGEAAASALLPSIFIKLWAGCGRFPQHAAAPLPPFVCSLSAGSRPAGAAIHGVHQGAGWACSAGRATRASPRHLLQFFLVDVGFFFSFPLNFREFCKNLFCLCLGKEVFSDTR